MVLNFAHRGSLMEAPENTLSAMKKAIEHGAKAVELDVQLTRNGHLVVIHDHKLTRFNNEHPGLIKDYTLDDIKQIDIGSAFSDQFAGETLATLDDVLYVCPPDVLLNIEIKNIPVIYEGIEKKVLDCLHRNDRLDQVIISSFDHVALETVQKLNPDIPLGMLFYYRMLRPWEYVKHCGLDIYSVHPNAVHTDKEMVDAFHALGYNVFPFTVSDEKRYNQLIREGVDGVFSNNPKLFGTVKS